MILKGRKIKPRETASKLMIKFFLFHKLSYNTTGSWLALKFFSPAKMEEIVMNPLSHLLTLLVAFVLLGLVERNVFDSFRELANVVALDYIVVYTKHDELRSNYL